jgi:hypothetical protein
VLLLAVGIKIYMIKLYCSSLSARCAAAAEQKEEQRLIFFHCDIDLLTCTQFYYTFFFYNASLSLAQREQAAHNAN